MSHLYSNYSSYWNPNDEPRVSKSLSKSLSLKVDSSPQLRQSARNLGFQLHDQDSSSSQSTQSNHDLNATAGTNSQDQCMSSESGQEATGGTSVGHVTPVYMMGQPENSVLNAAQIDYSRSLACMPYPCGDPYFGGLMTAYGPSPVIQPQMMGLTSTRVPLPLDITEDEPIYVNAKQYHGILRRRQSRAKLEAQNKLVKARKPYLHESRHLHALNRVRGSGGRFLSTKKQQSESSSMNDGNHLNLGSDPYNGHINGSALGFDSDHHSQYMETRTSNVSGGSSFFQQADNGSFLNISSGGTMQHNGGFMNGSNQHCASVVQ